MFSQLCEETWHSRIYCDLEQAGHPVGCIDGPIIVVVGFLFGGFELTSKKSGMKLAVAPQPVPGTADHTDAIVAAPNARRGDAEDAAMTPSYGWLCQ